jgi:hypothetical protein
MEKAVQIKGSTSEAPNGYIFYVSPKLSKYWEIDKSVNSKKMVKRRIFLDEIKYAGTDGKAERTILYLKSGGKAYHNENLTKFVSLFSKTFARIRTEIAIPMCDIVGFNNNEDMVFLSEIDQERVSKNYLSEFKKQMKFYFTVE